MKDGDLVCGTPIATDNPKDVLPKEVCGTLEIARGSIGSSHWSFYLVHVKDSDGVDVPVECDVVRGAGRRDKRTVLS